MSPPLVLLYLGVGTVLTSSDDVKTLRVGEYLCYHWQAPQNLPSLPNKTGTLTVKTYSGTNKKALIFLSNYSHKEYVCYYWDDNWEDWTEVV